MLIITSKTAKYKMLCVMVIQSTSRNLLCCVRNLPDGLPCNYVCRDKKLTSGIVHSIDIHCSTIERKLEGPRWGYVKKDFLFFLIFWLNLCWVHCYLPC